MNVKALEECGGQSKTRSIKPTRWCLGSLERGSPRGMKDRGQKSKGCPKLYKLSKGRPFFKKKVKRTPHYIYCIKNILPVLL